MLGNRRKKNTEPTTEETVTENQPSVGVESNEATTTEAAPKVKTKTPAKKTKSSSSDGLTGPMKALARGRAYLEFEPEIDEEGFPLLDPNFADKNADFTIQGSDVRKDRVVSSKAFIAHMNTTVLSRLFGSELTPEVAQMLIEGISNECLQLLADGYKIKFPNLVTMKAVHRNQRTARNPRTGESVLVPERTVLNAKAHTVAKAYLYDK